MAARPLLLIHGYSADAKAFYPLRDLLVAKDVDVNLINICTYVSLNNEITIKDIAEGLGRALRYDPALNAKYDMQTCEFDAIVHSTGMLVLRSWLTNYSTAVRGDNSRLKRLKHLIGVAPATWGSPQAHKGRTWLGALVKGNKELGPDFLNAGDAVLDGLELGSKFTWDLAHIDLLGKEPFYGKKADTPYACVFIGNTPYEGISSVANDPGTDGTVRWSGCGLNTRKITIDLTRFPTDENGNPTNRRLRMSDWADDRLNVPIIAVNGRSHATILQTPDPGMVDLIVDFLKVGDTDETGQIKLTYDAWLAAAAEYGNAGKPKMLVNPGKGTSELSQDVHSFFGHLFGKNPDAPLVGWQQFVIHAIDERGDPITDYLLDVLHPGENGEDVPFDQMYTDVHAYRADPSYRCMHLRLTQDLLDSEAQLKIRVHASSGTALIGYQGYKDPQSVLPAPIVAPGEGQQMTATTNPITLDVKDLGNGNASLFHPFTTTLIELRISREPIPLETVSPVLVFVPRGPAGAGDAGPPADG